MFGIKKKIDEILSEFFTNYDKENSKIGKLEKYPKTQVFSREKSTSTTSISTRRRSTGPWKSRMCP